MNMYMLTFVNVSPHVSFDRFEFDIDRFHANGLYAGLLVLPLYSGLSRSDQVCNT